MKLLVCTKGCDRAILPLAYEPQECACGATGGAYNPDGDTVTVWGDGTLVGLHNHALAFAVGGRTIATRDYDFDALWRYPEDNGKVTRLAARPVNP